MRVIAFLARAGSGKSMAAKYLEHKHDAVRVSFAGPLKELAKRLYVMEDAHVYGDLKERYNDRLSGLWDYQKEVTPRHVLQLLGNEARNIIGPRVWMDAAFHTISKHPDRLVVIDDCRYVNEAEAISCLPGGHVVKIESPDRQSNADPNHPSEAQVDEVPGRFISAIVSNIQANGPDLFYKALDEVVRDFLGGFPGRLRG